MSSNIEESEPTKRNVVDKQKLQEEKETNQKLVKENIKKAKQAIKKRHDKSSFFDQYSYHFVIGGFIIVCLIALSQTIFKDHRKLSSIPVIEEEVIEKHNSNSQATFQVGQNEFFQDWSLSQAKLIVNNQLTTRQSLPKCMTQDDTSIIPEAYNFRKEFENCTIPIYNQKNCSSSYTIASTSAVSDRICKLSKGEKNIKLSPQYPLSCDSKRNYGCKGGSVGTVFDLGKKEGLVDEECIEYGADSEIVCPTDLKNCQKYFLSDYCVAGGEEGIKREIYKNGPVVAVIPIYRDFLIYKSGIYESVEGSSRFHGGHAIKMIGWDKDENGRHFWILENSWGTTWGESGFVNVYTGQKNLYLDEFVIAPNPKVDKDATETKESVEEDKKPEVEETVDLDKNSTGSE